MFKKIGTQSTIRVQPSFKVRSPVTASTKVRMLSKGASRPTMTRSKLVRKFEAGEFISAQR